MRASRCATPRYWRIYHSGEGKSKVSSLSTTLTGGTTAGPESAMLNHLTLTRVVQSGGSGDTPDPGSILLHRLPSFPRSLSSWRRGLSSRMRGSGNPVRETPPQPPGPHSWGIQQMKRGFAPLHAPMGGIGKAKLAREAWTTPDPGQGQVPALDTLRLHPRGSYMT